MANEEKIPAVLFNETKSTVGFEVFPLEEFYQKEDKSRLLPHIVNFYVTLFITAGEGVHEIDFRKYHYQKGSAIFINKGQIHRWISNKNTQGFIILFTEDFLQKNQLKFNDLSYSFPYNSYLFEPILTFNTAIFQPIRTLIFYLYQEYILPDTKQKSEILQCLLRTFLLKIKSQQSMENLRGTPEQLALFLDFQRMIDKKIKNTRNSNDYCKWLGVSYKKLNDTCKIFTQNTAKNFINQVLLLKAKQFLADNKKSISEIAYLLSFEEPTNFTKFFKKHTNFSPKDFQKSVLLI